MAKITTTWIRSQCTQWPETGTLRAPCCRLSSQPNPLFWRCFDLAQIQYDLSSPTESITSTVVLQISHMKRIAQQLPMPIHSRAYRSRAVCMHSLHPQNPRPVRLHGLTYQNNTATFQTRLNSDSYDSDGIKLGMLEHRSQVFHVTRLQVRWAVLVTVRGCAGSIWSLQLRWLHGHASVRHYY